MSNSRPYDIIVYGASGFTGQYAALEMVRTSSNKKLAIAGRNASKLKQTLSFIEKEMCGSEESILEMCKQARVVASCVGP